MCVSLSLPLSHTAALTFFHFISSSTLRIYFQRSFELVEATIYEMISSWQIRSHFTRLWMLTHTKKSLLIKFMSNIWKIFQHPQIVTTKLVSLSTLPSSSPSPSPSLVSIKLSFYLMKIFSTLHSFLSLMLLIVVPIWFPLITIIIKVNRFDEFEGISAWFCVNSRLFQ